MDRIRTIITGTGCYIPPQVKSNKEFFINTFYGEDNKIIPTPPEEIVRKFMQITGIEERRYIDKDLKTSDIAAVAARLAIEDAGIDPETLDQIILAHNFGDVLYNTIQSDAVPSLAARVKSILGIRNPACVAYDVLFGCPGWLQGLIQADAFFKAGIAKRCLIIGAESLSRVIDVFDRDSMIFSDGAGACVAEAKDEEEVDNGILGSSALSFATEEVGYINMDSSYYPGADPSTRYMKMKGRKVYEFALKYVPEAMKVCLDKSGVSITDIKKIFIHQANEKMDEAIVKGFYKLYNAQVPEDIVPMNIRELGNSSVATIPTLLDMVRKGMYKQHELLKGDIILFASVGAGMNINAVCYKL